MKATDYSIIAVVVGSGKASFEIVTNLLHQNAMVIVPANDYQKIKKLSSYAAITTGKLVTLLTDIPDYQKVSELLDIALLKYGKIDLAVCAFDHSNQLPNVQLIDLKCSEFEQIVNDNIISYFIFCRLILHEMKKARHGVCIYVSDNIVKQHINHFSRFASFIEKIQMEMSGIFYNEVVSAGVKYYHLIAGNLNDTNADYNPITSGTALPLHSALGDYIISLYLGRVQHPENVFQYCITL